MFDLRKRFLIFGLVCFLGGICVDALYGINVVLFPYLLDDKGEMYVRLKQESTLADGIIYYSSKPYSCFFDDNVIQDVIIKLNLTQELSKNMIRRWAYDWFCKNTNYIFCDEKLKSGNCGFSGECFLLDCGVIVFFKKVEFLKRISFYPIWFRLDSLLAGTYQFSGFFIDLLKRKEVSQKFIFLQREAEREKVLGYMKKNNILSPQPIRPLPQGVFF